MFTFTVYRVFRIIESFSIMADFCTTCTSYTSTTDSVRVYIMLAFRATEGVRDVQVGQET